MVVPLKLINIFFQITKQETTVVPNFSCIDIYTQSKELFTEQLCVSQNMHLKMWEMMRVIQKTRFCRCSLLMSLNYLRAHCHRLQLHQKIVKKRQKATKSRNTRLRIWKQIAIASRGKVSYGRCLAECFDVCEHAAVLNNNYYMHKTGKVLNTKPTERMYSLPSHSHVLVERNAIGFSCWPDF